MDTVKLHDGSLTVLEKTGGDTAVLSRGKMWGGAWLASMSRAGVGTARLCVTAPAAALTWCGPNS